MKLQFNGEQDNELVLGGEHFLFRKGSVVKVSDEVVKSDKGLVSYFIEKGIITVLEEEKTVIEEPKKENEEKTKQKTKKKAKK
jgi:hypothetical protein